MNFTENEELATEEWRDVPEYEGIYQVSNLGRVKSVDRMVNSAYGSKQLKKGRLLKPETGKYGYQRVTLSKDGEGKMFLVHRLAYIAFNGEIPEGLFVNHIDENKENNRISNLNLMTCKENINWGTHNERMAKSLSKPVVGYDDQDNIVVEFPSTAEAGRNGFHQGHVASCCRGVKHHKTHKGLIWKFVSD